MTALKYPCELAFHRLKDRLFSHIQSALRLDLKLALSDAVPEPHNSAVADLHDCAAADLNDCAAADLKYIVQKIDYRASFGPYICEEKFDVFDEFERMTQGEENAPQADYDTSDFVHLEAKAEPKIDDYYRTLSADKRRATEYLIYHQRRWIIAWADETAQNDVWSTIDESTYAGLRQSTMAATHQFNDVIAGVGGELEAALTQQSFPTSWHLNSQMAETTAVHNAQLKMKLMLRHPTSQECLGTLTIYIALPANESIPSAVCRIATALDDHSELLFDLENAYAEMRELRRLALQKFNLSKVSRYLFKQKSLAPLPDSYESSAEPSEKTRRFLPRIFDATSTVLSFLGQYAQARHAILVEVYEDDMVDIYQTWSSTLEDTFTADRLAKGFDDEMRLEQGFLDHEIQQLRRVCRCLKSGVSSADITRQKQQIGDMIQQKVLSVIFDPQQQSAHSQHQDARETSSLPQGLSLRSVEHLLSSNQAFGGRGPQVKWYVAFVDRLDDTVEKGCLHRWNLHAQNGEFLNRRMTNELTQTVEILANELMFYLRSYKDQCKQFVWSNERALVKGEGFGETSLNWLNWLGDFLRQRVIAEVCEFYLPEAYFKVRPTFSGTRYPVRKLSELFDEISNDVVHTEQGSDALHFRESDWLGILRLVNTPKRSILYVSICEQHRHQQTDSQANEGYSTYWSIALSHSERRFSYVHMFLLEKVVRQVARLRRQAVNTHFQTALSKLFHHENALDRAAKALLKPNSPKQYRDVPKEYFLAEHILNVLQEHIIKPFIGLELPMLLATQNTTGHVIHLASNKPLSAQFELTDDALFTDGKATLQKLLSEMHQRDSHKVFKPGQLVMARPERQLEAGRYALALRLELLSGHLFDGVLLIMGRHNQAFDHWTINRLKEVAQAVVPILSISCINHQTHAQMGLFQHAVNSPVQGIISNAKSVVRRIEKRLGDKERENTGNASLSSKIKEAKSRIDRNAEQIRSWKRSLQALFGNVRVDLSRRNSLTKDIEYWVDRYREWALSRGIHLVMELPKFEVNITYDPERLDIAFSNVLDNAIKYSEENRPVTISVSTQGATVAISISNYGPYINESAKSRLLSFGQRSKLVAETMIDGQGIGLPVVHAFVQAHPDGVLQIHSERVAPHRTVDASSDVPVIGVMVAPSDDNNPLAKTRFTIRFRDNERDNLT